MGSGAITAIVIAAIVVILIIAFVSMYNGLVGLRNRVKEAWAQIDVQLKRRYDLLPNLVETVKGYATHEQETLTRVIEARNQAMKALQEVNNMMQRTGVPVSTDGSPSGMPNPAQGQPDPQSNPFGALVGAEGMLVEAVKGMQVTIEQYPDLKANQNFMQLQEELVSTENKIAFARQHYNEEVRLYNTKRESIPTNIVAGMGNFSPANLFEIQAEERQNVQISF